MFLLDRFPLLLFTAIYITLPIRAMDKLDKPDFLIANEYGKIIHLKLEFEYLDNVEYCAQTDLLIFAPGEQKPINLRQLTIRNCDTHRPINPVHLNCKNIIMSAWVPGSEIEADVEVEQMDDHKEQVKEVTQMPPKNGWNTVAQGWSMLKNGWNAFSGHSSRPDREDKDTKMNQINVPEVSDFKRPERCAALVDTTNITVINIIIDPIRFNVPMISGENNPPNGQ